MEIGVGIPAAAVVTAKVTSSQASGSLCFQTINSIRCGAAYTTQARRQNIAGLCISDDRSATGYNSELYRAFCLGPRVECSHGGRGDGL
jgi:hypothetical protein